jgi:hypothetical protein
VTGREVMNECRKRVWYLPVSVTPALRWSGGNSATQLGVTRGGSLSVKVGGGGGGTENINKYISSAYYSGRQLHQHNIIINKSMHTYYYIDRIMILSCKYNFRLLQLKKKKLFKSNVNNFCLCTNIIGFAFFFTQMHFYVLIDHTLKNSFNWNSYCSV